MVNVLAVHQRVKRGRNLIGERFGDDVPNREFDLTRARANRDQVFSDSYELIQTIPSAREIIV